MGKTPSAVLILVLLLPKCGFSQTPATPASFKTTAYERHVTLQWQPVANAASYKIYRSADGGNQFLPLNQPTNKTRIFDWTGTAGIGQNYQYKITALAANGDESPFSNTQLATPYIMQDSQLLEMVQEASFRYFWDYAHPVSGMARERSNGDPNVVTTGGSGFGVMNIVIAAERGWITRAEAVDRMIQIVSFLQFADRFHGVFPHWMNGNNGNVIPFSQFDDGGDLVETAFMMQGLLAARQYFDQNQASENALRDVIDGLWKDVEWDWYRRNNGNVLYWHWSPNVQWQMNFALRGFNETHIVYLLALASPTHPIPASLYPLGWAANGNYVNNAIQFGHKVYTGPFGGGPMFFAHYSYLGFDPRNLKDAYCNYFIRNQNHALIQYDYSIANPENHIGYSADCWGLTASDNPFGYAAHDIYPSNDNGTITPTAALASMPYTPDQSTQALRYFYRTQGEKLWGNYGFYDAFNLDQNWFSNAYLAIDQGPIGIMIENYRTGLLWKNFMKNPEIAPALTAAGFLPDNFTSTQNLDIAGIQASVFPTPIRQDGSCQLTVQLDQPTEYAVWYSDWQGKSSVLIPNKQYPAGKNIQQMMLHNHRGVIYLQNPQGTILKKWKI